MKRLAFQLDFFFFMGPTQLIWSLHKGFSMISSMLWKFPALAGRAFVPALGVVPDLLLPSDNFLLYMGC